MNKKTKLLPTEERPYEKAEKYGVGALSDAELLAIVLRCGTRQINSIALASLILEGKGNGGGLTSLMHYSLQELQTFPGVGRVKALELQCVGELSKRIAKQTAKRDLNFDSPRSIAEYYMEQLRHCEKEQVMVVMLNNQMGLIQEVLLSVGTVNASLVSTREIFVQACRLGAVFIVLVHNHPSGDPTPSRNDVSITKKVQEAGELLDIQLLDHIIIGDQTYTSFREKMICNERSQ